MAVFIYAIIFRNIAEELRVMILYALNEFYIQSSDNGQPYIDAATNNKAILVRDNRSGCQQQKNEDYTTVVPNLTRLQELWNNVF
jgi:hypothetical protein